jgi:hypothetical protein
MILILPNISSILVDVWVIGYLDFTFYWLVKSRSWILNCWFVDFSSLNSELLVKWRIIVENKLSWLAELAVVDSKSSFLVESFKTLLFEDFGWCLRHWLPEDVSWCLLPKQFLLVFEKNIGLFINLSVWDVNIL